jgi:hypothetical protein
MRNVHQAARAAAARHRTKAESAVTFAMLVSSFIHYTPKVCTHGHANARDRAAQKNARRATGPAA